MPIPRPVKIKRDDAIIVLILIVFVILFRLATLMIMNTGIDESDYWSAAKNLRLGLPYPPLTHRTVRWSLIIPVFFTQLIFGVKVNVYYVLPILYQAAQAVLLYFYGKRLHSRFAGILTALAITVFPYSARVGSQIRPEAVSLFYIMASLWFLLNYLDDEDNRFKHLVPSILFIYLAYHAKITNLYFLPGILFTIWILAGRFKHAVSYGLILLGLYVFETLLYAVFTEYPFGHLQIIRSFHFSPEAIYTFTGFGALFKRYVEPYLQWYWQIPFVLFGLSSIYYFVKRGSKILTGLLICAFSFFFFITFAALGLEPFRPVESLINRYFYAVLGIVFLVLIFAFLESTAWITNKISKYKVVFSSFSFKTNVLFTTGASVFFLVVILLSLFTPSGQRFGKYYAWDPVDFSTHALARNRAYGELLNQALRDGLPIVSSNTLAGENSLRTVRRYYLDEKLYRSTVPEGMFTYNGSEFAYLGTFGEVETLNQFVIVIRGPFKAYKATKNDLPELAQRGDAKFDDTK